MPEYLSPGVYEEEVSFRARSIAGIGTNTTLILGETERGPREPRLVTSPNEFIRLYERSAERDYTLEAATGFFENGGSRLVVARLCGTGAVAARLQLGPYIIEAIGPGDWGNRIWVRAEPIEAGLNIRLAYFLEAPEPATDPFAEDGPEPNIVEELPNIPAGTAAAALSGWFAQSALVQFRDAEIPEEILQTLTARLSGGISQPAELADVEPALSASESDERISLVYMPNASQEIARLLIDHCERRRDRFCVLDGAQDVGPLDLYPRATYAGSKYAAFYYPWIEVLDSTGRPRAVPPGGHVLGIYARTDVERGIFKPPANESIRGAVGLGLHITERQQEVINPRAVNTIRYFEGRGIRLWGARTLSDDPEWKYVSVRRYMTYLETSINRGLGWTVFEPNGEPLWAMVRNTVTDFLSNEWRSGGLQGDKADKAFIVKCYRSTMTEDDIANGRLVCLIGVAMLKPAEFIMLKVGLATRDTIRD